MALYRQCHVAEKFVKLKAASYRVWLKISCIVVNVMPTINLKKGRKKKKTSSAVVFIKVNFVDGLKGDMQKSHKQEGQKGQHKHRLWTQRLRSGNLTLQTTMISYLLTQLSLIKRSRKFHFTLVKELRQVLNMQESSSLSQCRKYNLCIVPPNHHSALGFLAANFVLEAIAIGFTQWTQER